MGLRDARGKRRPRESVWHMVVADPSGPSQRVKDAKQKVMLAGFGKVVDEDAKAAAEAELAAAQAELDECLEPVRFRGVSTKELERVQQAHPPTPEDLKENAKATLHFEGYLAELCSVSQAPDDEADRLTPDEWAELIEELSAGDMRALRDAVDDANLKSASEGLPKD